MNILRYDDKTPSAGDLIRKIKAEKPDVVHICACWSWGAWRVVRQCRAQSVPIVFSPNRQLEPWNLRHHYLLCKFPMLMLFQRGIIKWAHAIVATTQQEQKHLLRLGIHPSMGKNRPWNDRVVFIPDYRRSGEITEEEMRRAYTALYRKVIDSHPVMQMSADEWKAEDTLLRLGLARDELTRAITDEQRERVFRLNEAAWRRLLLHADSEGILSYVRAGAGLLQLAPQSITDIDRFPPRKHKNIEPLNTTKSLLKPQRLEELAAELHVALPAKTVCIAFLNTIHEKRNGTFSRRHLADLYATLRFTDYDEQHLYDLLRLLKEKRAARKLLREMRDKLGLEEGFTPF